MYAIPRYKYMFYATFNVNAQALSIFPDQMSIGTVNGISFKIKTVDKPNVELSQKELNQYNRKRYAYTKTEYRPVNISLYDTVDNKPFNLWIEYFTYYFGDARLKTSMTMGSNPTDPTFDDSTGWGLRPLAEQINFFTSLDVYALFGKQYTLTQYLNPKIASIDWGNHDTADSGLEDLKMSLTYETLQYDSGTLTPQMANQFGFDVGLPTLEPNGVQTPIVTSRPDIPTGFKKRSLDTVSDITSPSGSVISNFGMSGTSYNTLVSGVRNAPNQTTMQPTANFQYASGVGDTNSVYPPGGTANGQSGGLATAPSDLPPSENYGVSGLPNGQLPVANQWISTDITDTFTAIGGYGVYNLLASFGDFNFGSLEIRITAGSNFVVSTDPLTGLTSYRPGAPNDTGLNTALPIRRPGQQLPHVEIGYPTPFNTYYGNYGRQYRTQYQQIAAARRRIQSGEVSLTIAIGDPGYDNNGIYTGYNYANYQPAPEPQFGPNIAERAALSNNTVGSFGYLNDPLIYGGDPSDNEPPPVIIPYRDYSLE